MQEKQIWLPNMEYNRDQICEEEMWLTIVKYFQAVTYHFMGIINMYEQTTKLLA